jgi:hypothetical protein
MRHRSSVVILLFLVCVLFLVYYFGVLRQLPISKAAAPDVIVNESSGISCVTACGNQGGNTRWEWCVGVGTNTEANDGKKWSTRCNLQDTNCAEIMNLGTRDCSGHTGMWTNCRCQQQTLNTWLNGGELQRRIVNYEGQQTILLGGTDETYPNGSTPIGKGFVSKLLTTNGTLKIKYRIFTHDKLWSDLLQKFFDDFEISVNTPPEQISDQERIDKGCKIQSQSPADQSVQINADGLVFCDGNRVSTTIITSGPLIDLGWKTLTLNLNLSGNNTIYFANWNRWDDSLNTWTYVQLLQVPGVSGSGACDLDSSLPECVAACPRRDLGNLDCDSEGLINTMDLSMLLSKVPVAAADLSKLLINWGK